MNQMFSKIRSFVHRNHASEPLKQSRPFMVARKFFICAIFQLCCISIIWSSQICFAGDILPNHIGSQFRIVTTLASTSVKCDERDTQEIVDATVDPANGSDQQRSAGGASNEKNPETKAFWGKIVDSPSGVCELYREKDLVYISCVDSKRSLVHEGDRFAIFSDSLSAITPTLDSSDSGNAALGQIEITSAGSDLITGIILECRTYICNGSQISPLSETTAESRNIPINKVLLSSDGHKS